MILSDFPQYLEEIRQDLSRLSSTDPNQRTMLLARDYLFQNVYHKIIEYFLYSFFFLENTNYKVIPNKSRFLKRRKVKSHQSANTRQCRSSAICIHNQATLFRSRGQNAPRRAQQSLSIMVIIRHQRDTIRLIRHRGNISTNFMS